MVLAVSWVLSITASVLAILVAVFLIEIVAAVLLPRARVSTSANDQTVRQNVAVLVPAHNETIGIGATVEDIKTQLVASDRLLVIADNCSDDTACVAKAAGAEVIVRNDLTQIGKGFALAFGLEHLRTAPPQVVMIVDADCRLSKGAIDRLANFCTSTNRPVQALDLMVSPAHAPINFRVAEFAWRVRNWVRPLGMSALGLPCRLMGTGMAFPWPVVCSVEFASAELAEDQKLGPDLTVAGHAPLFCEDAIVTS